MSTETRKYSLKARAERQAETRRRIVEATAELHTEVGPAQTTVAEIARRAGVQRLTVYNNFNRLCFSTFHPRRLTPRFPAHYIQ